MDITEFSEEYAIFQSALLLADRIAGHHLVKFDRKNISDKKAVLVVTDAAVEIENCALSSSSLQEGDLVVQNLITTLLMKIDPSPRFLPSEVTKMESLTSNLPTNNLDFVVEIALKMGWLKKTILIIEEKTDEEIAQVGLMCKILDSVIDSDSNEACPQLFDVIKHVLLFSSPSIGKNNLNCLKRSRLIHLSLCRALLKLNDTVGTGVPVSNYTTELLMCFVNMTMLLLGYSANLVNMELLKSTVSTIDIRKSLLTIDDLEDIGAYTHPIQSVKYDIEISWDDIEFSLNIEKILKIVTAEMKSPNFGEINSYEPGKVHLQRENIEEICLRCSLRKAFFSNLLLLKHVAEEHHSWQPFVEQMQLSLPDSSSEYLTDKKRNSSGKTTLDKAIYAIDNNIVNDNDFNWLEWFVKDANKEIILNSRWIDCINRNAKAFARPDLVWNLINQVSKIEDCVRSPFVDTILRIFPIVNMIGKNSILHRYFTCDIDILKVPSNTLGDTLRDTFNRMGSADNSEDVANDLAVLALQSVSMTCEKMVKEAIRNKPQTPIIIEAFRMLPSLKFKNDRNTGNYFLTTILAAEIYGSELTPVEWTNCLHFCSNVLQADCNKTEGATTVSLLEDFIVSAIMPKLNIHNVQHTVQSLQILSAVLRQSLPNSERSECLGGKFPLSLGVASCIVVFLISCTSLKTPYKESVLYFEMVDLVDQTLDLISAGMGDQVFFNEQSWLYQTVNRCDWTVCHKLQDILDCRIRLAVPLCLLGVVKFNYNVIEFESKLPTVFNLLELIKSSCLEKLSFHWAEIANIVLLHPRIVLHLGQILLKSSEREWLKICRFLILLASEIQLTKNPQPGLQASSILTEVILIIAKQTTPSTQEVNRAVWCYLIKCYVSSIRTIASLCDPEIQNNALYYNLFKITIPVLASTYLEYSGSYFQLLSLDLLSKYEESILRYAPNNAVTTEMKMDVAPITAQIKDMQDIILGLPVTFQDPLLKKIAALKPENCCC